MLFYHFSDLTLGWCILLGFFTPFTVLTPCLGVLLFFRFQKLKHSSKTVTVDNQIRITESSTNEPS